jgi:predicted enzyme related to lactoylglutathione lyase
MRLAPHHEGASRHANRVVRALSDQVRMPGMPLHAIPSIAPNPKENVMANPFVHVELHTKDVAAAKKFYSTLFGWKLEDMPMPDGSGSYTMISVGEGTGGGMMKNPDPNVPPHWLAYVGVDDIEASTKRAQELGGKVHLGVTKVGDFGLMSVIQDPTGAYFAMWKATMKK